MRNVAGAIVSDSKNMFDRLTQPILTLRGSEKRSDLETLCLKEAMESCGVMVCWVNGDGQLANSLTKENENHQVMLFLHRNCQWRIVYDEELMSGKRRKQLGVHTLQQQNERDAMMNVDCLHDSHGTGLRIF